MNQMFKKLYQLLPIVRELREIRQALWAVHSAASVRNFIQIDRFFRDELKQNAKYHDPRKLNHHEWQVFSQNGEDGIVAEIFRRIGIRSKYFVETGVGDGLENNTVNLLTQGWCGSWLESDSACIAQIRSHFSRPIKSGALNLMKTLVTAENFESLLTQLGVPAEFDLLSLDIDRNTYHVLKSLGKFRPRVIAVEYNATLPPDTEWVAEYDPSRGWNGTAYFGASLKSFERLAQTLGYVLVGCDLSGTNAFFIQSGETLDLFAEPYTAENHHEPPRYWSIRRPAHRRCFDDFEQSAS